MEPAPTVSIVMPVYNAGKYLPETLEALRNQTLENIEILCVDDKSTDNSLEILREFAARDSRVRLYTMPENRGPVPARKLGMLEARGEFMMFADSDDIYAPNACERAVEAMRASGSDIVHFRFKEIVKGQISDPAPSLRPYPGNLSGKNLLEACFVAPGFSSVLWDKIYKGDLCRRAAAEITDDPKHCTSEDVYTFLCIAFFAKSYSSIQDVLYTYRVGIGYSYNTVRVLRSAQIIDMCKEFLAKQNALDEYKRVIKAITDRVYTCCCNCLLNADLLDRAIMEEAVRCWGTKILIDFIENMGVFRVRGGGRQQLVYRLVKLVNERL